MSRVFLLEPVKESIDISGANRFGDIITMFPEHMHRPSIWETADFEEAICRSLDSSEFDPENDFFLASGQTIPMMVAMHALSSKYQKIRVLFFHSQVRDYVLRVLDNCSCGAKLQ